MHTHKMKWNEIKEKVTKKSRKRRKYIKYIKLWYLLFKI